MCLVMVESPSCAVRSAFVAHAQQAATAVLLVHRLLRHTELRSDLGPGQALGAGPPNQLGLDAFGRSTKLRGRAERSARVVVTSSVNQRGQLRYLHRARSYGQEVNLSCHSSASTEIDCTPADRSFGPPTASPGEVLRRARTLTPLRVTVARALDRR